MILMDFINYINTVDVDEFWWAIAINDKRAELAVQFKPVEDIVYAPLNEVCRIFGRPQDEIILLFGALVTFFVCLPMPCIRNMALRKTYNLFFGVFMGFFAYGLSFWLYIAYVVIGWAMMQFLPRYAASKALVFG